MKPESATPPKRGRLRLGIDAEALRIPLSGVGSYVLNLCRELEKLQPETQFYAYSRLPEGRLAMPSSRWILRTEPNTLLRRMPSFLWLRTRGAALCSRDGLHLFWATRTLHPRLKEPVRTVSTVHDLNHLLVPETMQLRTLWSHRAWFEGDVARADAIVANSDGTAQRLGILLNRSVTDVVRPALDPAFHIPSTEEGPAHAKALAAHGIRAPYLLTVSTLEPRKNLGVLVEAFAQLKSSGLLDGYSLVLVGTRGWKNNAFERTLEAAQRFGVVRPGYVPRELLPALYANAEVFVLPSLYEGFGMPVLEARACGTKVVVSDTPELREAGGPHAIAVEPSVAGVRAGIQQALRSTPAIETELHTEYSWPRAGARLATIFSNVVRQPRRWA